MPMIRVLTTDDVDAYLELRVESFVKAPLAFDRTTDELMDRADVLKQLARSTKENFVLGYFLTMNGRTQLVGVWGFERYTRVKRKHRATISGVYVTDRARGRGIARQLLEECLRRARSMEGLERLVLSVSSHATGARKLYESNGFEVFGREPGAARTGDTPMDEIYMLLNL